MPAPPVAGNRPALEPRPAVLPADWHSPAELDAAERAIEARFAAGLRRLRDLPVIDERQRHAANQADQAAAAEGRERAGWHRGEAARAETGRPGLVEAITAAFSPPAPTPGSSTPAPVASAQSEPRRGGASP